MAGPHDGYIPPLNQGRKRTIWCTFPEHDDDCCDARADERARRHAGTGELQKSARRIRAANTASGLDDPEPEDLSSFPRYADRLAVASAQRTLDMLRYTAHSAAESTAFHGMNALREVMENFPATRDRCLNLRGDLGMRMAQERHKLDEARMLCIASSHVLYDVLHDPPDTRAHWPPLLWFFPSGGKMRRGEPMCRLEMRRGAEL